MLKKLFRCGKPVQCDILEKETIDEIIFRTTKARNRIMQELMARGGIRIGEVLNLTRKEINEQKLTVRNPKSGKEEEVVSIPRRLATRLKDYIGMKGIKPGEGVFPNDVQENVKDMVLELSTLSTGFFSLQGLIADAGLS